MATKLNYICDQCQGIKGEANKWWVLRISAFTFVVSHFSEDRAREAECQLACSSSCLNKSVSVWCEQMTKSEAASLGVLTSKSLVVGQE